MARRPGEATAAGIGFHARPRAACVCSTTSTVVAQQRAQHWQNPRPKEHPVHNRITLLAGTTGAVLAVAVSGCGGGAAKTIPAKAAAPASGSSTPNWQPGTPTPKITAGLIAQSGDGLTAANANLGRVDEVFGSVPANVHVDPSAKTLNDQYARFGRCMAEQMKIHDLGHELALLIAYNQKDRAAQAAVEKASSVCTETL
jgi:hypothetical protein